MISTVAEIKSILGITATTYDTQMGVLLPMVQEDICDYLNNYFNDPIVYRDGNTAIEFVRGNTDTGTTQADYITDTEALFKTMGFTTDRQFDILIEGGGLDNAGIHHVVSMTTAGGTITLDSTGVLNDVDMDGMYNNAGGCKISLVVWPKAIKVYVAQMIWWLIKRSKSTDVQSERIDDYSVSYVNGHAYPKSIISGLSKYRMGNTW